MQRIMGVGLFLAFAAAACSAIAALLQSLGARRVPASVHLDPRLLWRLVRCGPYAAGLALDGAASGFSLSALRTLPIFVVQAISASNLVILATLSTVILRSRLRPRQWWAIAGVVSGLTLLVMSAHPGPAAGLTLAGGWGLLAAALGVAAIAFLSVRLAAGAVLPGLLAGVTFGSAAVSGRVIGPRPVRCAPSRSAP